MRVRVLRDFTTANRTFRMGEVVEASPRKVSAWIQQGKVMQDKSLDRAPETKGEPLNRVTNRKGEVIGNGGSGRSYGPGK